MRNPNGFGGITKLSGRRRRPYWVRLTMGWDLVDGKAKQIYKTLGYYSTKKEAMIALAEYHQAPIDLTKKDITFAEVWDIWSPRHFEKFPSSLRSLVAAYKKCASLHNMAMKDIRKAHLQAVMDSMAGMSLTSQKKVKTVFSNTFKYCLENDILSKDYSQFVEMSGAVKTDSSKKYFTLEELKRVFDNLNFDPMTDTVLILLYTGMRIGELLNQKCDDIDLENRLIHVRGTKTENADRIVPIHREIVQILEKRIGGKYLVSDERGKKLEYSEYVRKFYDPFKEHIGVSHTPHALRHTFVSLMDASGVSANSVVLKRIVGHANSNVSEHYTHKSVDDLIEAIDKLRVTF